MKKYIYTTLTLLCSAFFLLNGCQQVEDLTPSVSRYGINSLNASFYGDESSENSFTSEINYETGVITIVFPYNYPRTSENVLTTDDLKKVRVTANLDDNVTISPSLLYMDLTKENFITVTDQSKTKKDYKIVAEIRKSAEAKITDFNLDALGISGIIDELNKTISLISIEPIGEVLAKLSISHGATISPDPRTTALNYDNEVTLTVTAQNGSDKAIYTIRKDVPNKVELGMRNGSDKVLWSKKLQTDLGISALNVTTSLAVTKDYVIVNTRNEPGMILDRKTGTKVGTMPNMQSIIGGLTNFFATADDGNNILICNLAPNAGTYKVWRINGVNGTPELYIDWAASGSTAIGRKLSIKGSLDGDAIITAAIMGDAKSFARWQVKGGVLQSQIPEIVAIPEIGGAWWNNADVVATNPSDPIGDYFVSYYALPRRFAWIDGKTNTFRALGPEISGNWVQNAADYTVFNGNPYAASNSVNSFTWGSDDKIYLFDASSTTTFTEPIWTSPIGTYGGKDNGGQNGNGTGDVILKVSTDGYYMYLYFMFTNGCVVCVQYDCIDM
ncbi:MULTISPECIES: DUF5018 domain-containing protein [unclassified Proteiniphilum]|jgi:hypothetical protein|uniref:DUF5018 domain-containing protein n=1 Tax=unclassified Proteiniphilum TaxID=2622718 RepID=UPI002580F5CF|nr:MULTISPECIES: DUF5018 domain-containing protein [unclassified Proteiniphilum]